MGFKAVYTEEEILNVKKFFEQGLIKRSSLVENATDDAKRKYYEEERRDFEAEERKYVWEFAMEVMGKNEQLTKKNEEMEESVKRLEKELEETKKEKDLAYSKSELLSQRYEDEARLRSEAEELAKKANREKFYEARKRREAEISVKKSIEELEKVKKEKKETEEELAEKDETIRLLLEISSGRYGISSGFSHEEDSSFSYSLISQLSKMEVSMKRQEEELKETKKEKDLAYSKIVLKTKRYENEAQQRREAVELVKRSREELEKVNEERKDIERRMRSRYLDETKRRKETEEEVRKAVGEKEAANRLLELVSSRLGTPCAFSHDDGSVVTRQPPLYFLCPVSRDVMLEPHVAADGFTYEAEAIRKWLERHETSPMTNLKLAHKNLVPNRILRSAIQDWLQRKS